MTSKDNLNPEPTQLGNVSGEQSCAFQYAYKSFWGGYQTPQDTGLITLEEAKRLWNEYLPDFIRQHELGNNPEMAIWINMKNNTDYRETLEHIDSSVEVINGVIHEVKRRVIRPFKLNPEALPNHNGSGSAKSTAAKPLTNKEN